MSGVAREALSGGPQPKVPGETGRLFQQGGASAFFSSPATIRQLGSFLPSASTVSRVFHSLESKCAQWKRRHLAERYAYAFADGISFIVLSNGEGCNKPVAGPFMRQEEGQKFGSYATALILRTDEIWGKRICRLVSRSSLISFLCLSFLSARLRMSRRKFAFTATSIKIALEPIKWYVSEKVGSSVC